jgi:hypothetical protein
MAQQKIELYISKLLEDLDNGLTWLDIHDTEGHGSIQTKYSLKDDDVDMIRKHPKLKDAQPRTSFVILIDDTIEEEVQAGPKRTRRTKIEEDLEVNEEEMFAVADTVSDSYQGFINL